MDTLNIDYNSLSPEQKKQWVKAEIERKRKQFRGEESKNGLSAELTRQFAALAMRLSPENLHEDGEITQQQAKHKLNQIRKEWKELEVKAGRKVTHEEFPY